MTTEPTGDSAPAARCWALVPCAGVGTRAGAAGPKQYVPLLGRPMLAWTLEALARVPAIACTLVCVSPGDEVAAAVVAGLRIGGADVAPCGGATRADTVAGGLAWLAAHGARDGDWVLVHDAARCLVEPEAVQRLVDACRDDAVGGLLALPLADTLKHARTDTGGERVDATLDRTAKWAAQTPQMFRLGALRGALARAAAAGLAVTDESSAMEADGLAPRLVRGALDNLKVTWPEDFALAERLLRGRDAAACLPETTRLPRTPT